MKTTNLMNLVSVARKYGKAKIGSGAWQAWLHDGAVTVFHYDTAMIRVECNDTVTPISTGWQSMTDKKGIATIVRNHSGQKYWEIFADFR